MIRPLRLVPDHTDIRFMRGRFAGLIVSGFGFGLVGNIVVGIVGAFIAGYLFPALGVSLGSGIVAAIIHATIGAVILLVLIKVINRTIICFFIGSPGEARGWGSPQLCIAS